ncbi:hypothetical protein [Streptomyces albipurpureus]|uniref:Uncharacterized protein n=1 Tax=Streptomyces albipurpureus TaxID=2897419 RepID=A0ABT0USI3_9ACTN|nr:hypothetical protein [Streptomyces sp. CWNU-1]MCM2391410.1 hypothetical protein [Streptomyces sp. CWNU-1]
MSLISKKSPEQLAQAAAEKERKRREAQELEYAAEGKRAWQAFMSTPVGLARQSFERGDQVFQCSISASGLRTVIIAIAGNVTQSASDPVVILNSVCREGWELVNGSFLVSDEGAALRGDTVGYYLFRRCEANWREADWRDSNVPGVDDERSAS